VEQLIKDSLQIGFSFFVAAYLLIVMTNLIRELREQFVALKAAVEQLLVEIRQLRVEAKEREGSGTPKLP